LISGSNRIKTEVKGKKKDISLRDMFRKQLDKAEVTPSASLGKTLMRKVAFREFLGFNPARFNIYYAGGMMAAVVAAAIILSSVSTGQEMKIQQDNSDTIQKNVSTDSLIVPGNQDVSQKTDYKAVKSKEPNTKSGNKTDKKLTGTESFRANTARESIVITPAGINESIQAKDFFAASSKENNYLKKRDQSDDMIIESSASAGCTPLKIQFYNKHTDYDSCRWVFGDGGSSFAGNPEWIFDLEGEYRVTLEIYKANVLSATASMMISVHPRPAARFEIYPEKAIIPDDEIRFMNYSKDAVRYAWNFGDGSKSDLFEPLHRYKEYGNYNISLVVSSEYGCSDSLQVKNPFNGSGYYIDFPNAFIPNADGPSGGLYSSRSDESAQIFHPSCTGVSDYHLKIFSKIGILIFESNDVNIGWDGYFNGQMSKPGVYIWKVRGNFINGEPFTKMGDVTLLSF